MIFKLIESSMDFMGGIPRSLFVIMVLSGFVFFLYISQPPVHICDSQLETFRKAQEGKLYKKVVKSIPIEPSLESAIENCTNANGPGGCLELFAILKGVVNDSATSSEDCSSYLSEELPAKKAVFGGVELMALLAWGAKPPEKGISRFGWYQASELLLFCQLQRLLVKMSGSENYEKIRGNILSKLPGEAPIYKEGLCQNCETRKTAIDVLPYEEVWSRSLFSYKCEQIL